MTPEQFKIFLESNERATAKAIEIHVNGKIRVLDQKLTDHMNNEEVRWNEIKPYLEGAAGLKLVRNFLIWIGSAVVAWTVIKDNFRI